MQVRDIMTAQPACCSPTDSVREAARLMEENDCGCIPIVDGGNCVCGVVTDRDIAVRGVGHNHGADTEVRELMTSAPFCCGPDADVREVEQIMADQQVRRVVIVDDGGCCIGMVAQADVARAAAAHRDVSDEEVGRVVERISEPSRTGNNWRL